MVDIKALPNDAEALKKIIFDITQAHYSETQKALQQIQQLTEENRLYRDKLFGRKSEKKRPDNDPNQPPSLTNSK